jgi:hypothetical protein
MNGAEGEEKSKKWDGKIDRRRRKRQRKEEKIMDREKA